MAGRIPQHFIDDLLQRTDIVDLIDSRIKLKKSGRNHMACCPFHEEKTPSFSVSPDKQFYYCFGCGAKGNAIGFLMDYDRLDFPQAVEELAKSLSLEVPREQSTPQQQREQEQQTTAYQLMESASRFYQQQLRQHPQAQRAVNYLKQRGLTGQIAKRFAIGFAPPGWDNLKQQLSTSTNSEQALVDAGLLVRKEETGRTYDRFRDRIIFPIRDTRGRVIAFGGRVLGDDKPKYLNSPETHIFHKGRELYGLYEARKSVRQLERLLIVEGYMDVVALAQHGIPYTVATLGTATSQTHLERIFKQVSEVVFCFDGDAAGQQAARRALETALPTLADGRQARFLFLPEGEDPDSLVRQEGAQAFEQRIEQAQPLSEFFFQQLSQGLNLDTLDDRARLAKLATPLIDRLPQGVLHQLMLNRLAELTGLSSQKLDALTHIEPIPKAPAPAPQPQPMPQERRYQQPSRRPFTSRSRQVSITPVRKALSILLYQPQLAAELNVPASLKALPDRDIRLLTELVGFLQANPGMTTGSILGNWYGTDEGAILSELATKEFLLPPDGLARELKDTFNRLMSPIYESRLQQLQDKLQSPEGLSQKERTEFNQLLRHKP